MTKPLAEMKDGERLAMLDESEVAYDIAYRAAKEAEFPNGSFDDFRLGDLAALKAADRRAGEIEALVVRSNLIREHYLDEEDPHHDDTGRKVVLMILSDIAAHIAQLESEASDE